MAPSTTSHDERVTTPRVNSQTALDATGIVSVLNAHAVRYMIIGAFAAIAQQAPIAPTRDIELTPDDGADNLERLSAALRELDARVRADSVAGGIRSTMTPRR